MEYKATAHFFSKRADRERMFELLFREGDIVEIRFIPNKDSNERAVSYILYADDIDSIDDTIFKHFSKIVSGEYSGVYYGLQPRKKTLEKLFEDEYPAEYACSSADVEGYYNLGIDIDLFHALPEKVHENVEKAFEKAKAIANILLEELKKMGITPLFIGYTGYGIQVVFGLLEIITEKEKYSAVFDHMVKTIKTILEKHGISLDDDVFDMRVKDLPRVFRIITTPNAKRGKAILTDFIYLAEERVPIPDEIIEKAVEEAKKQSITAKPFVNIKRTVSLKKEAIEKIANTWAQYWIEGRRHYLALALAGLLYHRGVPKEDARQVIENICYITNDEEAKDRLKAVDTTYDEERIKELKEQNSGVSWKSILRDKVKLSEEDFMRLVSVVNSAVYESNPLRKKFNSVFRSLSSENYRYLRHVLEKIWAGEDAPFLEITKERFAGAEKYIENKVGSGSDIRVIVHFIHDSASAVSVDLAKCFSVGKNSVGVNPASFVKFWWEAFNMLIKPSAEILKEFFITKKNITEEVLYSDKDIFGEFKKFEKIVNSKFNKEFEAFVNTVLNISQEIIVPGEKELAEESIEYIFTTYDVVRTDKFEVPSWIIVREDQIYVPFEIIKEYSEENGVPIKALLNYYRSEKLLQVTRPKYIDYDIGGVKQKVKVLVFKYMQVAKKLASAGIDLEDLILPEEDAKQILKKKESFEEGVVEEEDLDVETIVVDTEEKLF